MTERPTIPLFQPSPGFVDKITLSNRGSDESTLKSSGDFYLDPFALVNFSFVQRGPRIDGYYSEVAVQPWTPINLVGVKLFQMLPLIFEPNVPSNLTLAPHLDLHAFTPDGKHVGMNYSTGVYENQIPGAVASGDLIGADQWIFVPSRTNVTYEVSSHDVGEFLEAYPQFRPQLQQQSFNVTYMGFDQSGNPYNLTNETLNITPNSKIQLQGTISEFQPFPILPLFIATTLIALIICRRRARADLGR